MLYYAKNIVSYNLPDSSLDRFSVKISFSSKIALFWISDKGGMAYFPPDYDK